MSNIIKGARVRSESILDLSSRVFPVQEESTCKQEDINHDEVILIDETIKEKQAELLGLEELIQKQLEEANKRAEEIVNAGYERAKEIESSAQTQAEVIISEASRQQEEMLKNAGERAADIKAHAIAEKEEMLLAVEGEVVETIIKLTQHIISKELVHNTNWIKYLVRKMLMQEAVSEEVILRISNTNKQYLESEKEELIASLSKLAEIEADETLNETTLVLVTSQGNIEYDVSYGLDQVISELRILKSLS